MASLSVSGEPDEVELLGDDFKKRNGRCLRLVRRNSSRQPCLEKVSRVNGVADILRREQRISCSCISINAHAYKYSLSGYFLEGDPWRFSILRTSFLLGALCALDLSVLVLSAAV